MTDRFGALTVILDRDIREVDAYGRFGLNIVIDYELVE